MKQNKFDSDLYKTLFNMTGDIVFYHELLSDENEGNFIDVNDRACVVLGYTREEFHGMTPRDLLDDEQAKGVDGESRELEARKDFLFEKVLVCKDGRRIPVEIHARLFEQDGKKLVLSTARDISHEKRTRMKLNALLKGAQAVLKYADFEVSSRAIFDTCCEITGAQSGYVALLSEDGMENEVLFLEAGGLPCTVDTTLPMPIRGLREQAYRLQKTVYHNDFMNSEYVDFMPDGHVKLENVMFAPLNIGGKTVGVMGIANKPGGFTDEDAEIASAFGEYAAIALHNSMGLQTLTEKEEYFRALIEHSPAGVIIFNSNREIVYWSNSAKRTLGYASEEILGNDGFDYIHPEDLEATGKIFEKAASDTGTPYPHEIRIRHKNGDWAHLTCSMADYTDNPAINGIVVNFQDISGKKRTEAALRDSEEKFRYALEATNDGLWDWNIETKEVFFSPKWGEILGFKPNEITPDFNFWESRIHPDDRDSTLATLNNLLEGNTSFFRAEHRLKRKDGDWMWVLGRGKVVKRDENGVPLRALGTMTDIVYRKILQLEITEKQQMLDSILNTVPVSVAMVKDSTLIWANEFIKEMLGYTKEEIAGRSASFLYESEEEFARVGQLKKQNLAGKGHSVLETRWRKKNGEIIDVLLFSNPVETQHGSNTIISCAVDITEQKKTAEAIKTNEERLRNIFENSKDAIFWADVETGELLNCNRSAENLLRKKSSEIIGNHHSILHPPEKLGLFNKIFAEHVDKDGVLDAEAEVITKDGEIIPVHITSNITRIGDRLINQGIFRDISQQIKARETEKLMAEQDKMATIGRVADKMAHDFNNVLGIILGISELLLSGDIPDDIRDDVKIILDSSERGRNITRNLLMFAKDQELKVEQFDLNESVESVVKGMRAEMEGVKVSLDFGAGLENVTADSALLENSLINLVQNSLHAMSKLDNPHLSIKTYKTDNRIFLEVADNGCGIPEYSIDNIFDPSFTLKGANDHTNSYMKGIRGSGYGLANVKKCAEKHGGRIHVKSRPGEGSVFTIELPIIEEEMKTQEVRRLAKGPDVEGRRILLVEDEIHFGNILYQLLRNFKHNVDIASTGSYALNHLENNDYDVISLDFVLPDMTGMDVYKAVREKNADVPVVFVSGNFEFMQSMIDLKDSDPCVDHLAKPFNGSEYIEKIHSWLQKTPAKD